MTKLLHLLAVCCLLAALPHMATAQEDEEDVYDWGTVYYGVKGGLGINNQNWDRGVNTGLIFTPLIDVFAESYDPGSLSRLYAQIGFHQRGSALGAFGFRRIATYTYSNVVVELGGRRQAFENDTYIGYYLLGLRGEYTLASNVGETQSLYNLTDEAYLRRFNYGATVGGGFEYDLGDGTSVFLEVTFNPDLSAQYDQPVNLIFPNPNAGQSQNQFVNIPAQRVRNYSLEVKVGYKWLR